MKVVQKYIIYEIFPLFIMGNIFFIFLLIIDKAIDLTDLFFAHGVPIFLIIETLFLYLPSFLVITIPTSMLLSSLIAFSRFAVDSELVVLKSSGSSGNIFLSPVLLFSITAFLFSVFVSIYLIPAGNKLAVNNLKVMAEYISINDLNEKELYRNIPGYLIYAGGKKSDYSFNDLLIIDEKNSMLVFAEHGEILPSKGGKVMFNLSNGRMISSSDDYSSISFENFVIDVSIVDVSTLTFNDERFMTLKELKDNFEVNPIYKFQFSSNFALPFATLIMGVFGFSLGNVLTRSNKMLGVFISLSIVMFYNMIYILSKSLIYKGFDPFFTPWISNIIFSLLSVMMLRRVFK